MKKNVIRIIAILFILIVVCQSFCYADVIWRDANGVLHGGGGTLEYVKNRNIILVQRIIIIGIVVIAIVVLAYLVLRAVKKKKKIEEEEKQEENTKTIEASKHYENELTKEKKEE